MLDDDILSRFWFVIQAAPSRQHDAAQVLRDREAVVYQPLSLRSHRPNRHAKRRWWYYEPIFSRYLLAGFRAAPPPWFSILDHSSITRAVDYRALRRTDVWLRDGARLARSGRCRSGRHRPSHDHWGKRHGQGT